MAKVRIEMNPAGMYELMRSEEMANFLELQARALTLATGMTYEPDVWPNGKTRANAGGYKTEGDK